MQTSHENNHHIVFTPEKLCDDWEVLERKSKQTKPIQLVRHFVN
jgi:hypothetical protein